AACDLFPGSISSVFDPLMHTLGYDPGDLSTDTSTPTGVGNVAARAVLDFRHRDGANQLGDEPGGIPGVPYSDYTGYTRECPDGHPLPVRSDDRPRPQHMAAAALRRRRRHRSHARVRRRPVAAGGHVRP